MSFDTGLNRSAMIPYPAEPRDADLPLDEEFAVRADYANANWRKIAEAIGNVLFKGVLCTEGTITYGASDSTHCRLTLPDDYTELDDILHVGDGSREWIVQVSVENEIEFTDSELTGGSSGNNNYNTIQDSLTFRTISKDKIRKTVTKNQIVLGNFADGLHSDDIRRSAGADPEHIVTIDALLTRLELEHDLGTVKLGKHKDGFLENDMLDKDDVLSSQSFVNRVKNSDFNINDAASRDYWDDVLTPVVTPTGSACGTFPSYFVQVDTNILNEGIRQLLKGFETDQPVTCEFWAKGNAGGENIKVTLNSPVEVSTLPITLTTTWTKYSVQLTPDSQCNFYVNFLSDTGSSITWFAAKVMIHLGDVIIVPERSMHDFVADGVHPLTFFKRTTVHTGNEIIAKWTSERAIKILRASAYVIVAAAGAAIVIRLTDGVTDYDTTISSGNNEGENTGDQEYPASSNMELSVIGNFMRSAGTELTIVFQYRIA